LIKNVILACGLGDIFTFLTRLDDFFLKNPEYTSIKFWGWVHHPNLAKELVSLSKHNVEIYSVEDMTNYLKQHIPEQAFEEASNHFIKQNPTGVGVDKYLDFINRFFPNLEQWVWIGTYKKYKTTYPFSLNHDKTDREKKYIVVHPFSSTVKTESSDRTWAYARWGGLLKILISYCPGYDIILIGTKKDKVETQRDFPAKGITDLRGKLSLTETVNLIYGAEAMIGINSWPVLMAYWNNIPTYVQWFVQPHFLETHVPRDVKKMKHVFFELARNKAEKHPTAEQAWANVKKVLDATITI